MHEPPFSAIAVDWTGVRAGEARKLWMAEVHAGELVRLERGRTRAELTAHLVELAARQPRLIVGLGFAFSFPCWFLRHLGVAGPTELWERVRSRGESWLASCDAPFWGLPGHPRPPGPPALGSRGTERRRPPLAGTVPKSVFQVGGQGTVGTASLRGMPFLAQLRRAGLAVLPFDAPRPPLVLEIYPRYLTGSVEKSSPSARALYLSQHFPRSRRDHWRMATASEDAFDALVGAHCLADHVDHVLTSPPADDSERLEGRIWWPPIDPFYPMSWPALRRRDGGSPAAPLSS